MVVNSKKPYEENRQGNRILRRFSTSINEQELTWHRDARNRVVKVLKGTGWKFQLDDNIPVELTEGDEFYIPAKVYHRVIMGHDDLEVEIIED